MKGGSVDSLLKTIRTGVKGAIVLFALIRSISVVRDLFREFQFGHNCYRFQFERYSPRMARIWQIYADSTGNRMLLSFSKQNSNSRFVHKAVSCVSDANTNSKIPNNILRKLQITARKELMHLLV